VTGNPKRPRRRDLTTCRCPGVSDDVFDPIRLTRALLAWYRINRREMPWRGHPDPYAVWVSEIMLQQTQVDTVRPYFARFMARFPTLASLAAASDDVLLKQWEGLGYYARARNLRKAAQVILDRHHANLPQTLTGLAALPGIGPYTAAAISSICFGVCEPVVDGNVARVFSRFWMLADDFRAMGPRAALADRLRPAIIASGSPGDFNQAIMELGALLCTPRSPACEACPLRSACAAAERGRQCDFPVKPATRALPERCAAGFILRDARNRVLLVRRDSAGLLGGLWELPGGEIPKKHTAAAAARLVRRQTGLAPAAIRPAGAISHIFSHFRLRISLYTATVPSGRIAPGLRDRVRWSPLPADLPLTTTTRRALADTGTGARGSKVQGFKADFRS